MTREKLIEKLSNDGLHQKINGYNLYYYEAAGTHYLVTVSVCDYAQFKGEAFPDLVARSYGPMTKEEFLEGFENIYNEYKED